MINKRTILTVTLLATIFVGITFTVISVVISDKTQNDTEMCTARTEGTVVDILQDTIEPRDIGETRRFYYYPVVEYMAGSETIRKQSSVGGDKDTYEIGDRVEIFYDPDDPEHFCLEGNTSTILTSVFRFVGIGMLVTATVLGIIITSNKVKGKRS